MSDGQYQKGWLAILQDNFHSLMKKHDMPEDIANDIETFVLTVAKDQFRAGSKGAIGWYLKQKALEARAPKLALAT